MPPVRGTAAFAKFTRRRSDGNSRSCRRPGRGDAGNVGEGSAADLAGLRGRYPEDAQQVFGHLVAGLRVVTLGLVLQQLAQRQQRSGGHGQRELGISDVKAAGPVGGDDVAQRPRRQTSVRQDWSDADIEQHTAFLRAEPKETTG